MAVELWHIEHIEDTFANLNTNMDEWQWGNITDADNLIGSMDSTGYISVYAAQYKTNDGGSTKTYLDAIFDDVTVSANLEVTRYIRLVADSTNRIDMQDNDIAILVDNTTAVQFTDVLTTFNPAGAATLDFVIESNVNAFAFFVDAGEGYVGINTNVPARALHIANANNVYGMRLEPNQLFLTPVSGDISIDSGDSNILKWYDGSNWQSALGGASGSAGYIQFATAGGAFDSDAALFWDDANKRLGIGTVVPVGDIHINNAVANDTILLLTNAITGATATDGGKIWMDSAVLDINNQSSGGTTFSIAGAEKMRIDNSGTSIGIGITNPNFYKDGADTFVIGTTTASADRGMTIVTANDSTGTLAFTDNTSTSPASIDYDHATDAMTIRTGAATAITIDSSQNVGIGIDSTYRLDVSTDALTIGRFVSTEATGENTPLIKIGRNAAATDGDILSSLQWVGQNSATTETVFSSITGFAPDVTAATEDGTLAFFNSIAGSLTQMLGLSTAVVINDSGADIDFRVEGSANQNLLVTDAGNNRVGIGLNHPAVFMEIQDPGNNTTLRLSNAASPDRYAQFHATNYGYLNITTSHSNTRVGINNAGPNYTLDVLGTSGPQIGAVYTDGSVQTSFETNSSGHMTIVPSGSTVNIEANTFTLGGGQDIDTTLNFNSSTNDGVFAWKNTEDYFSFSDDIHIFSTERLYLRDTAIYINSITDGHLDLTADIAIDLNATTTYVSGSIGVIIEQSTADIYTLGGDWQDIFDANDVGGCTGTPTGTMYVKKVGKTVTMNFSIAGLNDDTDNTFSYVLPFTAAAGNQMQGTIRFKNAAGDWQANPGMSKIVGTSLFFYRNFNVLEWTGTSTQKRAIGRFEYQSV